MIDQGLVLLFYCTLFILKNSMPVVLIVGEHVLQHGNSFLTKSQLFHFPTMINWLSWSRPIGDQCFGSAFIIYGCGSRLLDECGTGFKSRPIICKFFQCESFLCIHQINTRLNNLCKRHCLKYAFIHWINFL
jgi:hypothetical protein